MALRAGVLVCLQCRKQTNQKAVEARGWCRLPAATRSLSERSLLTPAPGPGLEIGTGEAVLGPDGPHRFENFYNAAVNFLNCVPVLGLCLIAAR